VCGGDPARAITWKPGRALAESGLHRPRRQRFVSIKGREVISGLTTGVDDRRQSTRQINSGGPPRPTPADGLDRGGSASAGTRGADDARAGSPDALRQTR